MLSSNTKLLLFLLFLLNCVLVGVVSETWAESAVSIECCCNLGWRTSCCEEELFSESKSKHRSIKSELFPRLTTCKHRNKQMLTIILFLQFITNQTWPLNIIFALLNTRLVTLFNLNLNETCLNKLKTNSRSQSSDKRSWSIALAKRTIIGVFLLVPLFCIPNYLSFAIVKEVTETNNTIYKVSFEANAKFQLTCYFRSNNNTFKCVITVTITIVTVATYSRSRPLQVDCFVCLVDLWKSLVEQVRSKITTFTSDDARRVTTFEGAFESCDLCSKTKSKQDQRCNQTTISDFFFLQMSSKKSFYVFVVCFVCSSGSKW